MFGTHAQEEHRPADELQHTTDWSDGAEHRHAAEYKRVEAARKDDATPEKPGRGPVGRGGQRAQGEKAERVKHLVTHRRLIGLELTRGERVGQGVRAKGA